VQTASNLFTTLDQGWIVRVQLPTNPKMAKILILIHGLTGDENSMWVFGRQVPGNYLILAPRAIHPAKTGGYSWTDPMGPSLPDVAGLQQISKKLLEHVQKLAQAQRVNPNQPISIIGFSQGCALGYTLSILYPELIDRMAGLAGFLPKGIERFLKPSLLDGKKYFISHGSLDTTVPISKAYEASHRLEEAGADVRFCEEPIGHKMGSSCMKGLVSFFSTDSGQA
jgi:phospholipase/carboxylesterase